MQVNIDAKYFDGQSSAVQQVTVLGDHFSDDLCFQQADGSSFVWRLDDLNFERYDDCLEIRNKLFPGAMLQINDAEFSKHFLKNMKRNNKVDVHHRLVSLGFPKIVAIAVVMLGLIALAYFYLLPPLAEKSAELLPETFDNYLGNVFMKSFLNENEIDDKKTADLEEFASKLDFGNQKTLHFAVVESKEVNAFALPNGQIVVYSAILKDMQNADELAALLGHEASHINLRHSTKMLCRNLAGYMLISLIFSDVNGIMAVLVDNAQQLHSLSYSRKFEQQADEHGLKILIDNHIDPNGMVRLFACLEQKETISVPEIISTHPLTKGRKENMQKIIAKSVCELRPHEELDLIFSRLK